MCLLHATRVKPNMFLDELAPPDGGNANVTERWINPPKNYVRELQKLFQANIDSVPCHVAF
jgi:hypothetical protein